MNQQNPYADQLTPQNAYLNNERLNAFFGPSSTYQQNEPLAMTRQRRDLTKGFKDSSDEGGLASLLRMQQMEDPRESFYPFEDGYHTPAMKQPHHPSFMLNDIRKQAIAGAMYPEQQGIRPNLNAVQQLLEIIQARK
jgi:hypothetical protein